MTQPVSSSSRRRRANRLWATGTITVLAGLVCLAAYYYEYRTPVIVAKSHKDTATVISPTKKLLSPFKTVIVKKETERPQGITIDYKQKKIDSLQHLLDIARSTNATASTELSALEKRVEKLEQQKRRQPSTHRMVLGPPPLH